MPVECTKHGTKWDSQCGCCRECERHNHQQQIDRVTEERDRHRKDLEEAAGECLVELPEPGTNAAKLLRANRLLRSAAQALIDRLDLIQGSDEYKSVWTLTAIHGMPYAGPTSEIEIKALRDVLTSGTRL